MRVFYRKHSAALLLACVRACALALALIFALPALAEDERASLTPSVGESDMLPRGSSVTLTLDIKDAEGLAPLIRISMGEGLTLEEESILYIPAAMKEAAGEAETQSGAYSPAIAWGNDGCMLVLSGISSGDTLIFRAKASEAETERVNVKTTLYTEDMAEFGAECAFTLEPLPTPAPTPEPTPAPTPEETLSPTAEPTASPTGKVYVPTVLVMIGCGFIGIGLLAAGILILVRRAKAMKRTDGADDTEADDAGAPKDE